MIIILFILCAFIPSKPGSNTIKAQKEIEYSKEQLKKLGEAPHGTSNCLTCDHNSDDPNVYKN